MTPFSDNAEPVYGKNLLGFGRQTIASAGTAESLATSIDGATGVYIKALSANTGLVYVGDSTVDNTNGYELSAGEEIFLPIASAASIFIDAATNSEGVSYFIV